MSVDDYRSYLKVVQPCGNMLRKAEFIDKFQVGSMGMSELCDQSEKSFWTVLKEANKRISNQYGCTKNKDEAKCTDF